ncbi:hypothetical protein [Kordia sp.]|uniref:hypothetical protein n=1 Tax=Kordia sp. TaxID=1965332 RepID=UPI003B5C0B9C
MEITIEYQTIHDTERKIVNLKPEHFFEKDEHGISINSVQKNIFPYEYLDEKKENLILITLSIKDGLSFEKRDLFFWNNGKNETDYFLHYSDKTKETFEWMIVSNTFINKDGDEIVNNIKMLKDPKGIWLVTNNWQTNMTKHDIEDVTIDVYKSKIGLINGFRKD